MVLYHTFLQQLSDHLINEVGPLVTGEASRAPKSSDNIFEDESGGSFYSAIFNWCSFNPYGKVIYGNNNIFSI